MNRYKEIILSLYDDLKLIKKTTALYTCVYMATAFFSKLNLFHGTSGINESLYMNISTFALLLIQTFNGIYFQRMYTKQKIPGTAFNPVIKVILHTYLIAFLQILMLIPLIAVFVLSMMIVAKITVITPLIALTAKLTLIILALVWAARLLFIPMLMVYQTDRFNMTAAVAHSKAIFKKNLSIVLPLFLMLYIPVGYMLYTSLPASTAAGAAPLPQVSWMQVIVPAITGYFSSLIYCKLVVDYYTEMMRSYLPPPCES
ncbi:MAG: hypothetical protein P1P65_05210 [Treponema sp.]